MSIFSQNGHYFANSRIRGAAVKTRALASCWLGLLLSAGLLLSGCSEPVGDEARIRQRIAEMESATEAKQLGDVMQPVHKGFLGNKRIRKVNLKALILLHFRRNKNVHVYINDLEVVLMASNTDVSKTDVREAKVTCNVVMAGRNQTLPEHARVLQVTSVWKKIDDDWFVVSASWKDPLLDLR